MKELASWIESNILMELRTAPFDRKNTDLVPDAGSCHECPKRTGANALLFPESQRDSCLDRLCFQSKIDAHIASTLERNPKLIHISTSWNGGRNGGPLGRNNYVEILPAKSGKKAKATLPPAQVKCPHATEGLVMEGGERGKVLTICADPACPVHHAESQRARLAQDKARADQRKQDERRKEELVARQRILAAILSKVAEPTKPNLELVAKELFGHLSTEYRTVISEQLKLAGKDKGPSQKDMVAEFETKLHAMDLAGLSRLLLGMSLLDATFNTFSTQGGTQLNAVAKRYRINTDKIREAVSAEFADKRKKQEQRQKERASGQASRRASGKKRAKA